MVFSETLDCERWSTPGSATPFRALVLAVAALDRAVAFVRGPCERAGAWGPADEDAAGAKGVAVGAGRAHPVTIGQVSAQVTGGGWRSPDQNASSADSFPPAEARRRLPDSENTGHNRAELER